MGASAYITTSQLGKFTRAFAATQGPGLSDPASQPKFANAVPNALDPGFIYNTSKGSIKVGVGQTVQYTGLVAPDGITPVPTTVWGYGDDKFYTWPGRTFQVRSYEPLEVKWENELKKLPFLITGKDNTSLGFGDYTGRSVVDTSLHWAYSLHGYTQFSIEKDGVPTVPHVHGGHTDDIFDGNPEYFFSPGYTVRGPKWVEKKYQYDNSQPAGTVWYHDHALGITRLNVYAGMAGFYIIRDDFDTGEFGNPLDLPAFPYEAAFAIQDRMFKDNGELFYPAFPGDPFYDDFIIGEGAILPPDLFPGGGPTGLAEFFGDHMLVNGVIWPKMEVERRNYRLRFLNGCDSRFLVTQFFEVPAGETDFTNANGPLPFTVVGSDQGLASSPTSVDTLVMETGSRYDIVFDFKTVTPGNRVIMKNIGFDTPFGFDFGDDPAPGDVFENRQTDRIMAFDVVLPLDDSVADVSPVTGGLGLAAYAAQRSIDFPVTYGADGIDRTRSVALFEGTDEFGRLQPLLGTVGPATDYLGLDINWPDTPEYSNVGLVGPMEGAIAWHSPTTENPALGTTEQWDVWNVTGDSHPVHLHLVHFDIIGRKQIVWDSHTIAAGDTLPDGSEATEDDETTLIPNEFYNEAAGDGTYLVSQPVVQHNGLLGNGFKVMTPTYGADVPATDLSEYVENAPKDMVTARPSEVTQIKATFDKPGRYVWHCHILSHEDHEMMRVLHVGDGAFD
jgi:FtsP/CotA-like multicopper oxidase with cupredoxin domain